MGGILAVLVADTSPGELRGTGFGIFNLVSGVCLLVASVVAGWLWEAHGARTTFYAGAALGVAALVLLAGRRGGRVRR